MKTINRWMSFIIAVVIIMGVVSIQKIEAVPSQDFQVEGVSSTKSQLQKGDQFGLRVDFREIGKSPDEVSEIEFNYADFSGNDQIATGNPKKQVSLSNAGADYQLQINGLIFLGGDENITFKIYASNVSGPKEVKVKLDIVESSDETGSLKIENDFIPPKLKFSIEEPKEIRPGLVQSIKIKVENRGGSAANQVKIKLEGREEVEILEANNVRNIQAIAPKHAEYISYKIKVSSDATPHKLPLKINYTYQDERGEPTQSKEQYIYPILKQVGEDRGEVVVEHIVPPQGTVGPRENFEIKFTLAARGGDVGNVKVLVSPKNPGDIVPNSQNLFTISRLKKGFKKQYAVSMSTTSNASSQSYPIKIEVTYESAKDEKPITFKKYTSVDVYNPEIKTEESENEKQIEESPKVVVKNYRTTPNIVRIGEEFELQIGFVNTSETKAVHNLKVSFKVKEDENDDKSIFTPVNAANTFYVPTLGPEEVAMKTVTMDTDADGVAKTYQVQLELEYKDSDGNVITGMESIEIPVAGKTVGEFESGASSQDRENKTVLIASFIIVIVTAIVIGIVFAKKKKQDNEIDI